MSSAQGHVGGTPLRSSAVGGRGPPHAASVGSVDLWQRQDAYEVATSHGFPTSKRHITPSGETKMILYTLA